MKLDKIIMNPIRLRMIQYLMINDTAIAGDLIKELPDVPRTTLYRHLATLERNGVIKIVEEHKIRGTIEKVYALEMSNLEEDDILESAKNNALNYFMGLYGDFVKYFSGEEVNPQEDRLFIKNVSMYLTDKEFDNFCDEMEEVFDKFSNRKEKGSRKLRTITTVSSPS